MSAYETEALPELGSHHEISHEGEAFLGGLGGIAPNAPPAGPGIAQRPLGTIARQVAQGRPVTAQGAIRTLARQTSNCLRRPHWYRRVIRRSRILDGHAHRLIGTAPGIRRPVYAAGGGY